MSEREIMINRYINQIHFCSRKGKPEEMSIQSWDEWNKWAREKIKELNKEKKSEGEK